MRHVVLTLTLLLYLISSNFLLAQEQIGRPMVTNYSYQNYEAAPVNWWALEDKKGNMYFANGDGILQYDGVNWKLVESTGGARCMVYDDNGIMYAGGQGDLGYLEPDSKGEMKFISLKDKIPEEYQSFGTVWEVDYYKNRIIFRTTNRLYIWDGDKMKVIVSEDAFHVGKIVHDVYYIRIWNRGLCYMTEDDTFEVVPGGEMFANERVYLILPYDDHQVLLGSRLMGFFLYDGKSFKPFKTDLSPEVLQAIYLPGIALENGNFIVNTFAEGTYLIDHNGKLIQKYTTANGLQDGSTSYVYLDSRGVLWMPLFNGISKVNLNSSITVLDTNMGLSTKVVFSTYRFKGMLYLGTNNGVFYLDEKNKELILVEGTAGQFANFLEKDGRLYSGSGSLGLIEIIGKSFRTIRSNDNYDFRVNFLKLSVSDPKRLLIRTNDGLASFYFNDKSQEFEEESYIPYRGRRDILERKQGGIWVNSDNDGEINLLLPIMTDGKMDFSKSDTIVYGADKGLPDSDFGFWGYTENEIAVMDRDSKSTYTYNSEKDVFEKKKLYFDELIKWEGERGDGIPLHTDHLGRRWFSIGHGITVATKNNDDTYEFNTQSFKELKNRNIYSIYVDPSSTESNTIAWFSGPDGVVRYEGDLKKNFTGKFDVAIRSVTIAGDSLIYAGSIDFPDKLKITADLNSVSIDYAAPFFISQKDMQYSTNLAGLDKEWSEWTKKATREYINLPPGDYDFKVKAKNVFGDISDEAMASFSITPPWYKTLWAYALYILGFILLIYTIVRSRTKILVNQQKVLEDKVNQRTEEVHQRLDELATVNEVSQALTQKLELSELIQMVGNQMKNLFKSDITYLALLDTDKEFINFPYQEGDAMPPMPYGEGLTSSIIKTGDSMLINHDTDISATYDKIGVEQTGKNVMSYLGVPIPVEDNIIGVLSVQSTKQASRFTSEDERLLSTIAINVGVALHNAELYEEAKEAKAKAEDANEAKSAFLSTVSHELRTPLTSVLGFAKIIRKRLEDKVFPAVTVDDQKIKRTMKQVSENLNVVVSEGERLTNLINDVLDLAKIESGRMEWHMRPIFLQDVISRAIASTSALFEEKGLKLVKNISPDLPLISADEDKLIQVVINLLSNAVKFTDKGKVTVEAYIDNAQIMVEVQDTGIGIAEEDRHKIFERFRQAGDTLTDKPKGTGLGLPICREIIEHHGGIIWMKSEHGVGSSFFFTMPVMGEGSSEQPIQLDRILNSLKKQIKHSSLTNVKQVPTILVVDDDTPIRSLLRQELGDAGYQVKEAANGKAALDMVRLSKPDLIILDVMMPEINGFDVAAVLKNDPATMDIPIIILSIVQDKERGLKIGVDRYLTKPINTEQLFHEVDELLEQGVSKKKVLVVDDDTSAVKTLSDVLSARGYKVMESDPKNLLKNATESKPDIIMLNSVHNADQKIIKDLKGQKGMENTMFFIYE
ncbi:response regulator [Lutimonas halocynthiae]|uniref:response regulator n=1 Tax=Lutimonas halocynthiae TaxID=1446477 RepID=UPI0025B3217D|nr:response regulator [Lutimonas halocynthiae]MDN3642260.1 response regulator [Lutimonas halocynthiae]